MKIKEITEYKIIFDNDYEMYYDHDQDCCEDNYADFEILKTYNLSTKTGKMISIFDVEFAESLCDMFVDGVEYMGFNIQSTIGEKFFIPCYSDQNGYYTTELVLYLKKKLGVVEKLDVTEFVNERTDY